MKTFKKIVNEIKDTTELTHVVEVYEQVAASKMQKIRNDILTSREFFEGLVKLSKDVGADFEGLVSAARGISTTEAAVFVSANAGLYGDIIARTFDLFLQYLDEHKVDAYVVGKVGEEMMRRTAPGKTYRPFEMSDEEIEEQQFNILAKNLAGYERITVFYGRFQSIVSQESQAATISGEILSEYQGNKKATQQMLEGKKLKYLYEPDVAAVSNFFGKEIMTATFEAMLRESQLAKYGSRLMHLDMAINKIEEQLGDQNDQKLKIRKRMQEKKQRASLGGILFR
jgi:F0F1-type ATP synthase gamma subunit